MREFRFIHLPLCIDSPPSESAAVADVAATNVAVVRISKRNRTRELVRTFAAMAGALNTLPALRLHSKPGRSSANVPPKRSTDNA